MSDFCFVEDACQARFAIGDGARGTGKVCRMVNAGRSETSNIEPLRYLAPRQPCHFPFVKLYRPERICLAVGRRSNGCDRIEDGSC